MSATLALRDTLSMRVQPAAAVGSFLLDARPVPDCAALAPDWPAIPGGLPAAGEGGVRCLQGERWQAVGLFDLVEGDPRELDAVLDGGGWQRWRGRFAFAAQRRDGGEWLAVTDHFNTLPMYYAVEQDQLLLCNRLGPLLRAPWCQRRPDPEALFHYLNFACVPAPHTIVPEVRRLPPAGVLRWRGGAPSVERWWRPAYAEDLDGEDGQRAGELRERIVATVQRYRPGSEASWGCFLSGGTDSSSITSILARQHAGASVHSYSIGFAEADYNELDFAREAARACGAEGHFGSIDEAETLAVLPRLVELYDQPFGNASAVPTLACAAMAARDGRNVLLAGDGGDEIFGGNERYAKDRLMQAWYRLPAPLRGLGRWVGRSLGGGRQRFLNRIDNFTRRASLPNPDRFYTDDAFASEHFDALLGDALRAQLQPGLSLGWMRETYSACSASAELHRLMALDLELAIAQNDLVKVDGACRHAGVGARFPYLDPDLVEYAGRLPARFKLRGGEKRYLFKQAMAGILPPMILQKRKQGFGLPVAVWIRDNPGFREMLTDLLLSERSRARGWFQPAFVERLLERHLAGAWDHAPELWQMAVLELWMRRHLDA
ncbi:asparagine synthetase B family protein [Pseudomarimonas salicorniae]|uniref:asparagine synthase (glutamine-hydrolyzing) n=1 Tax=Pseudomarimonas salicorniae TaxID=2933270 RepID=A0ABT0GHH6_9GAMM|nr:asparagine synthase C-terminal domain-containing protein [Lysobacter sp. CAU 1642]MCK7593986.1 asparagine synthase C-terminal domain-containing protein [Lysobacter sp. CAU 1642]